MAHTGLGQVMGDTRPAAKLTEALVLRARRLAHRGKLHVSAFARAHGVTQQAVTMAVRGSTWACCDETVAPFTGDQTRNQWTVPA